MKIVWHVFLSFFNFTAIKKLTRRVILRCICLMKYWWFLGLNTSLVPMYISEISPLNLRGGLGTVNQLAVTIGLLISQILGIKQILGTDDGWPVLLGKWRLPLNFFFLYHKQCPLYRFIAMFFSCFRFSYMSCHITVNIVTSLSRIS